MMKFALPLLLLWLSGTALFAQGEAPSPAALLAEEQLVAYNQKDIEAFLHPYSDSVRIFGSLQELRSEGIDAMRASYTKWFDSLDSMHCNVVNRMAVGNAVVDHEQCVFKRPNQKAFEVEAVAIYKVWDGKIQEVYFLDTK